MNQKRSTFRNSKIHYSSKLTKTIAKKRNDKTNDLNTSNTSNELILGIATRTMTKFFAQLRETLKTLKLLKLCVSPLWRPFLFGCMLLRAHPRATKPCRLVFEGEGRTRRASSWRIEGFLYVDSSMEGIHEPEWRAHLRTWIVF